MTNTSIRIAIAMIIAALSISISNTASAASYLKCYKGWASGYDKSKSAAGHKAIAAWDAKAQTVLATSGAKWIRATNRQKHIKRVHHNGKPTHKASVYGKYCKSPPSSTERTPAAGRGPKLPMARRR